MIDIDIIQANNSTHQEIDQLMIELQEDRIKGKIRDTLIDLHNYAAMAIMLMDEGKKSE